MLTLLYGTDWTANRKEILRMIAQDVTQKKGGRILLVPELISHETERRLCAAAGDPCFAHHLHAGACADHGAEALADRLRDRPYDPLGRAERRAAGYPVCKDPAAQGKVGGCKGRVQRMRCGAHHQHRSDACVSLL